MLLTEIRNMADNIYLSISKFVETKFKIFLAQDHGFLKGEQ